MEAAHFPKDPAHTGLTILILDRLPKKKDGSSAVLKIALEKEGEKRKKNVIATRSIRNWSPTQLLTLPNRA